MSALRFDGTCDEPSSAPISDAVTARDHAVYLDRGLHERLIVAFEELGESVDAALQATVLMGEKLREINRPGEQYRRRYLRRGRARAR